MNVQVHIEVVSLEPVPAVVLSRKTDRRSFQTTALDGIRRVRKAVAAARVPTAGPPFVRHLSLGPRPALEIGIPLDGPHIVPTLRTTILPGGRAASMWHIGSHETVFESLDELSRWVAGHAESSGDPWQWYWTEPDVEQPRIQIVWPVR